MPRRTSRGPRSRSNELAKFDLQAKCDAVLQHFLGLERKHLWPIGIPGRPTFWMPIWIDPRDQEFDGMEGSAFVSDDEQLQLIPLGSRSFRFEIHRPPLRLPPLALREAPAGYRPRIDWRAFRSLCLCVRLALESPTDGVAPVLRSLRMIEAGEREAERWFASPTSRARAQVALAQSERTEEARLLEKLVAAERQRNLEPDEEEIDYEFEERYGPVLPEAVEGLSRRRRGRGRPPTTALVIEAAEALMNVPPGAADLARLVAFEHEHCSALSQNLTCYFTDPGTARDAWDKQLHDRRQRAKRLRGSRRPLVENCEMA